MSKQLGFDIDYVDPNTQLEVPWALPTSDLVQAIEGAPWKVVDIETTGLNPASKEQNFSSKDLQRGVNPELRQRVLSVLYPRGRQLDVVAFDFDRLDEPARRTLCAAALSGVVFGHNVGFDAYWLRLRARTTVPALLLDSMLIARVLQPDQPLLLAALANNEDADEAMRQEAIEAFLTKRSGFALSDLALTVLGRQLAKDLQGPKHWCAPFLTQQNYDYATGDATVTHELLCRLLGCDRQADLKEAYLRARARQPNLALIEPQVWDVVQMREHGMPWSTEAAEAYVAAQWNKVREQADVLVDLEPALKPHYITLANAEEGVTADLRTQLGEAFQRRGLVLDVTEKESLLKIGEKDLRRVRAQKEAQAKPLFDAWVTLQRAKKAGGMAREFTGFARRGSDGRLHSNLGHGPVTGRLSSSEPNVQQAPRDQGFRNAVEARPGHQIVSADYSALDMRVGAALAIRAQREIFEAYLGEREVAPDVRTALTRVLEGKTTLPALERQEAQLKGRFLAWKERHDQVADSPAARKAYWERYRALARELLLARFTRCYQFVRQRATAAGSSEWGSLRDAFNIPGMDIHTWTALGMQGDNPQAKFAGLDPAATVCQLKDAKHQLGDKRQSGKVGNLSLLYAMQTHGLVDTAAKNYNIHWEFEEADKVRQDWFSTYVEVDLWHTWTELNPVTSVYLPDPEKGGRFGRRQVYASYTLGGRLLYAFGLNAALSYQDQSTGADILGHVLHVFAQDHPEVFATVINQVHDELLFEVPTHLVASWVPRIQQVMVAGAEKFTLPFGVHVECSPSVGEVWLKD